MASLIATLYSAQTGLDDAAAAGKREGLKEGSETLGLIQSVLVMLGEITDYPERFEAVGFKKSVG